MTTEPSMAEFFGLHQHPFADTRPVASAFLTPRDQRLCQGALSLLSNGKSFALCGASGTGKSTLVQYLISRLDPTHYKPVWLHYAGYNRSALLRAIAEKLGIDTSGRGTPLLMRLQKHLLQLSAASNPQHPVLLIDDAQLLETESMLDLCSLLASSEKKTVAASLVLIGDETLRQRLSLHRMAPVRTRLTTTFPLEALEDKQSLLFLAHRLQDAKAPKEIFETEAMELMAAHCRGNRRELINCATLLLHEAYLRKEKTVNAQTFLTCPLLDLPQRA